MRKYKYNPTKPRHYILPAIVGTTAVIIYIYSIIYISYVIGGNL